MRRGSKPLVVARSTARMTIFSRVGGDICGVSPRSAPETRRRASVPAVALPLHPCSTSDDRGAARRIALASCCGPGRRMRRGATLRGHAVATHQRAPRWCPYLRPAGTICGGPRGVCHDGRERRTWGGSSAAWTRAAGVGSHESRPRRTPRGGVSGPFARRVPPQFVGRGGPDVAEPPRGRRTVAAGRPASAAGFGATPPSPATGTTGDAPASSGARAFAADRPGTRTTRSRHSEPIVRARARVVTLPKRGRQPRS